MGVSHGEDLSRYSECTRLFWTLSLTANSDASVA